MTVAITWHNKVLLGTKANFLKRVGDFDFSLCPDKPGVYVFARKFGKTLLIPIYIGKATNIRKRLKTQFNNHKLMQALASEKSGERVLLFGTIDSKSSSAIAKKLSLAERTHVAHALTAGYPLVNVQLTKGKVDIVRTSGTKSHNHPFPHIMLSK
jgi:hypothetical protein